MNALLDRLLLYRQSLSVGLQEFGELKHPVRHPYFPSRNLSTPKPQVSVKRKSKESPGWLDFLSSPHRVSHGAGWIFSLPTQGLSHGNYTLLFQLESQMGTGREFARFRRTAWIETSGQKPSWLEGDKGPISAEPSLPVPCSITRILLSWTFARQVIYTSKHFPSLPHSSWSERDPGA